MIMPIKIMNSIDAIAPFAEAINEKSIPNIQVVGGIGSVALAHPDVIIDVHKKEVIAPPSLYLSNRRDDGTLRDIDIFVLSSKLEDVTVIKSIAEDKINDNLELSISGIKSEKIFNNQINNPFGSVAIKSFLSDRYRYKDNIIKSVFPFAVKIDPESLETWTLIYRDMYLPISNPAMSIISYTNRLITGVRPKDSLKLGVMISNVFSKSPELLDWAIEGPGASQLNLGLLLRSLTPNKKHKDLFELREPVVPLLKLAEHESFMLPELSLAMKRMVIGQVAIKAFLLSMVESMPVINKLSREFAQHHPGLIVNND
jgi:hypothetical protein